jgi:hypothetical protein
MATVEQILNIDLPKPTFALQPSRLAPLPSDMPFGESGTGTGRNTAGRTLDPVSGKYVSKGPDVPRIYGADQSLLVEAAGRTNHVHHSSVPSSSKWSFGGAVEVGSKTSLIKGETAYEWRGGGDENDRIRQLSAGSFHNKEEVAYMIIEDTGDDPITRLAVENKLTGDFVAGVEFDWSSTSESNAFGNALSVNSRQLFSDGNGPNGGAVYWVQVQYDASTDDGDAREYKWDPQRGANSLSCILHHAQIEEARNASSPIVTQGSPVTRAGDDYAIFEGGQPEWWNPNEGTIIAEVIPTAYPNNAKNIQVFGLDNNSYKSWGKLFYNTSTPIGWTCFDGSNAPPVAVGANAFTTFTAAVSLNSSKMVCSANGQSNKTNHNGDLLSTDTLTIGEDQKEEGQFILQSAYYIPRALPESTLNTLTS